MLLTKKTQGEEGGEGRGEGGRTREEEARKEWRWTMERGGGGKGGGGEGGEGGRGRGGARGEKKSWIEKNTVFEHGPPQWCRKPRKRGEKDLTVPLVEP